MEFHPYANCFPLIEGEEFNALVEDIKGNGLLLPITLFEGQILDGRNRYLACLEAGIEPRYENYTGNEPARFVCSANIRRRDLTSSQKAAIAVMMLPALEAEAKKRQLASQNNDAGRAVRQTIDEQSIGGRSTEQAAELCQTNRQYVSDAKKLQKEAPELLEKVRSGELTIPEAKRLLADDEGDEEGEIGRIVVYPTPKQDDGSKSIRSEQGIINEYKRKGVNDLNTAAGLCAIWGTPTVRDHKDTGEAFEKNPDIVPIEGRLSRQVMPGATTQSNTTETASTAGLVLNPAMSRWLMGYPADWDRCSPGWSEWEAWQEFLRNLSSKPSETESAD